MIQKIKNILQQYKIASWLVFFAIIAVGLTLIDKNTASTWVLNMALLIFVSMLLVDAWTTLQTGRYGINILGPVAIITSLFTADQWAGLLLAFGLLLVHKVSEIALVSAKRELRDLSDNRPDFAVLVRGRKTTEIAVHDINPGDRLFIPSGMFVPVDATVISGTADIKPVSIGKKQKNYSATTGSTILSGSIVTNGELIVRALSSSKDSYYQRFIKLLQNSSRSTTPFIRMSERLTLAFSVIILFIGTAAWIINSDPRAFLSVLMVATPLALTTTPRLVLVRSLNAAARLGIFFKSGAALEHTLEARTIMINDELLYAGSTATIKRVTAKKPYDKETVLSLATALTAADESLIASVVSESVSQKTLRIPKLKHITTSRGVAVGRWQGKDVWFGTKATLLERLESSVFDSNTSENSFFVIVDGAIAGSITIDQSLTVKKASVLALSRIGGLKEIILAGNSSADLQKEAQSLGFTDTVAASTIASTLQSITDSLHKPVAYATTRTTDAPALTAADIGITLNAENVNLTDHANIVAVNPHVSSLQHIFLVSKGTFSSSVALTILGMGAVFILAGIALFGLLAPVLGALLQIILSILFIIASIRTPRFASSKRL